ncbi:MAG: methionine synthase [bacterium]|nr:methionine synthase [bacterium]
MKSAFLNRLKERVLVCDGATGTSVHALDLPLKDFNNLENCNEVLVLTRPDAVRGIHHSFLEVGCDAIETNTFGGSKLTLAEFGLDARTREINRRAAEIAREACGEFHADDHPRFVIGSIGPGTKLPSLGHVDWDTLVDSYLAQALGLVEGGVDALSVETCQDILQAKAAIVACIDAMTDLGREVPIICQVTMETTGTMLVGTDMAGAITALEAYPQVQVIGMNCATGPQEMSEHLRVLSKTCDRLISIVPNAGLPQLVDGQPHYPLSPEELARWMVEFVESDGVSLVGGCCGTTPAHIQAVVRTIGERAPIRREFHRQPSVSSLYQAVTMRQDSSALMVGERSNTNGSRRFKRLLLEGDLDELVAVGREQVAEGAHVLDVCVDYVGRDGVPDMERIIGRYAQDITVPLMLDSTEPEVIEAGLKLAGGKCIVNSVNLEDGEEKLARICPLLRRYGAAVVALTIDEDPQEAMAKTAERKLEIAHRLHDLLVNRYGLASHDIFFDTLTFPVTTGNEADRRLALETLEAISRIRAELPQCQQILGVSNVSFGLKPAARAVLNSAFLSEALARGLTGAIVHPSGILPRNQIGPERWAAALDLIHDRRREGHDPLLSFIGLFEDEGDTVDQVRAPDLPVEGRLKQRIINGDGGGLEDDLEQALTTYRPLDIINDFLLDGMKTVGDLFAAGQMQLPFVLRSAETMKAAVTYLKPLMEKQEDTGKGVVVLATVRGDVHDIGKNLVDIILTNNGYTVRNLGIKQPVGAIIDAWKEGNADAIGLSGLLVKSTLVMRENLAVLEERGLAPPVLLGGAALTRKYVEQDLRPEYSGPLFYAKDAFEGLHLMDRIMAGEIGSVEPARLAKPVVQATPRVQLPTAAHSTVARDVPIPVPPFWGSRVIEHLPFRAIVPYINEKMLFNVQWHYQRAGRGREEFRKFIDGEVRPIFRDLVQRCEEMDIVLPQAVYGYWPAQSDGNALVVYDPEDRTRQLGRFEFPRQYKEPYWCISDFFRSVEEGEMDVVAFSLVTAGARVSEKEQEWFHGDQYTDYLHLHGMGVEAAEALAEYLHRQIRSELGIAGRDAREIPRLFQQKYQGSRYSFGYPACPRLEDQVKLWPLLEPERIGVALTEDFHLEPEQTTTALVCHHPEARYFNVR